MLSALDSSRLFQICLSVSKCSSLPFLYDWTLLWREEFAKRLEMPDSLFRLKTSYTSSNSPNVLAANCYFNRLCYRYSWNSLPFLQVLFTQHGYTLFSSRTVPEPSTVEQNLSSPPPEPKRRAYTPNKDDTQNDVAFTAYSLQSTSKLHWNKFLKPLFTATTQRRAHF